jgi:hypothetical protein
VKSDVIFGEVFMGNSMKMSKNMELFSCCENRQIIQLHGGKTLEKWGISSRWFDEKRGVALREKSPWVSGHVFTKKSLIFGGYPLVMTNSLPWKITRLLIGKPSISMGHLYHGYVK